MNRQWLDKGATGPSSTSARMLIPGPPNDIARMVFRRLNKLPSLVTPRVCSAVFHTLWNGWCTAPRWQKRGSSTNHCWLGCQGDAQDDIKHYSMCPIARDVLRKKLKIVITHNRQCLPFFMLCRHSQDDDELITLTAMYTYSIYMTTNLYRNINICDSERATQCLGQFIIQCTEGNSAMGTMLESRWSKPCTFI